MPCKKSRRVCFIPDNKHFIPTLNNMGEIFITIEEIEAIRLSDLEQMEQNDAAIEMNVSRGTYQRIIYEAHFKIADALVHGKAIHIRGGEFEKVCCANRQKKCCKTNKNLSCENVKSPAEK